MTSSSFRDPGGFVLHTDSQVFRILPEAEASALRAFLATARGRSLVERGNLIASHEARPEDRERVLDQVSERVEKWSGTAVLEHDRIWFPSYPYEWPRAMLQEAARITLDLSEQLLEDGYGLKDASPYNVLFRGADAVFVDALSIEKRDPADPIWRPLAQFLQTFLYPLILDEIARVPVHETLFGRREGLSPEDLYYRLSWFDRCRPRALRWVSVPKWLASGQAQSEGAYRPHAADPEVAQRMLRSTFRSLRRAVDSVPASPGAPTAWSDYSRACHYEQSSREIKRRFVAEVLRQLRPGKVLDLGANDGEYSRLAAEAGHDVVACDIDPAAVGRLWQTAQAKRLPVLPLVGNIASPSPAMGWGYQERRSLLDRAQGQFDCVMMLALLHHLTVTERVPLGHVLDLAAGLSRRLVIAEWIAPEDPLYRKLLRGRASLHQGETQDEFERICERRFRIVRRTPVMEGRRWLYLLEKA